MKPLTSHNYKLEEIPELRSYNAKRFRIPGQTKERGVLLPGKYKFKREFFGSILSEFHVKPIHYIANDGTWRDLSEVSFYFGNKRGLILKEGWENKIDFGYLVWYMKRQQLLGGRGVRIGVPSHPLRQIELPLILNTTTTVYPDPNTETTSVDGFVQRGISPSSETWTEIRGGAGTTGGANDSATADVSVYNITSATTNKWVTLLRSIYLFDTSSITDTDTISAGTFSIYITTHSPDADAESLSMVTSTPASNTALADADFSQLGVTKQATDRLVSGISNDVYSDFTMTATGLGNISKTGVSKFGIRQLLDLADSPEPGWSSAASRLTIISRFADTADTTSDPKLVVTHAASATFVPAVAFFM